MLVNHEIYMQRCLELARKGAGSVAPNPMVGAVLVFDNRIIGEGWHQAFGAAHAEVNCFNNVLPADQHLIPAATLYVSLEPCAHYGKTPPCSKRIIAEQVKKVVIGCLDEYQEVNGKGIAELQAAGVEVMTGVLEQDCRELNKRFFIYHKYQRPYIVLKWAMTANGMMGSTGSERLLISNAFTNRTVHQWRSEEAAILVGSGTVLADDPQLTNRYWYGKHPVRMVIDRRLQLAPDKKIFQEAVPTVVFNLVKESVQDHIQYVRLDESVAVLPQILDYCYRHRLQSLLVEGGAKLLQLLIDAGIWDEARIITNTNMLETDGIPAPTLPSLQPSDRYTIGSDLITTFENKQFPAVYA